MDQTLDRLDRLEKKVLVEVVQLVHKRRMRGTVGGWKDFLNLYDKKFGCSVSDPSRRSDYELSSFLKTFNKKKDLKFIEEALQSHMNRDSVEQSKDIIPADESPEQILESEKAMLLLHKIPISVPSEELRRVVPGDFNFTVRVKNDQLKANARGRNYCAVVIFSNPQEADQAFENVNGKPEKDSAGLPQKLVEFQFDAGITTELYVRKMARDNPYEVWRKKRVLLFQGKENSGESKKLNTEQKIKEEISSESKKLKTEQEIKEEEISCESKKLKTEQEIKEEISGESKKLKTQQEIMVDSNQSNCDDHLKEIESSRQEFIEEALQSHMNRDSVEQSKDIIPADESPEQILESEKAMLLLHKIPISVPSEELHRVVPGDFNFAVRVKNDQLKANARGRNYCAVVIFSNPQEADQAFENVNGKPEKDSAGLPQKLVEFQFDAGITTKLYVRKMARDNPYEVWRKKRVLLFQGKENSGESKKLNTEQKIKEEISSKSKKLKTEQEIKEEEISCESKKLKTEQEIKEEISGESKKLKTQQEIKEEIMVDSNQSNCDDHLKEIESSRQEVSENDFQISTQDKIISEPRKKVRRRKKIDKKKEQN
ncbi:hypothetical protein Q3G72_001925 [Acer saccharum]|nr:hypothetical protein Q3G72_001925 [Acer saccharum]